MKKRNFKLFKRDTVVETMVSLRTKYLEKEVKTLCDFNFKVALLALLSAVLTACTTLGDSGNKVLEYISKKI